MARIPRQSSDARAPDRGGHLRPHARRLGEGGARTAARRAARRGTRQGARAGGHRGHLGAYPDQVESVTLIEPDRTWPGACAPGSPPIRPGSSTSCSRSVPSGSRSRIRLRRSRRDARPLHDPDPGRALAEVARVLRPGRRPVGARARPRPVSARRARWQDRLERPWTWVAGGCHLNRDTRAALVTAGFDVSAIEPRHFRRAARWSSR